MQELILAEYVDLNLSNGYYHLNLAKPNIKTSLLTRIDIRRTRKTARWAWFLHETKPTSVLSRQPTATVDEPPG